MKKNIFFLFLLGTFTLMGTQVTAQSLKGKAKKMVGAWVLDDVSIEPFQKDLLEEFRRDANGNTFLTLAEDGTGSTTEIYRGNRSEESIKWKYDQANKMLLLEIPVGMEYSEESVKVIKASKKKLVLSRTKGDTTLTMYMKPVE